MTVIAAAVGAGRPNRPADVRTVQQLLNRARRPGDDVLDVDGSCGPLTQAAIRRYQVKQVRLRRPDSVIDPGGPTIRALNRQVGRNAGAARRSPPPPAPRAAQVPSPTTAGVPALVRQPSARAVGADLAGPGGLTESQYVEVAAALDCEVAAVKAVVQTEATRGAFDAQGRPTILFERHKFHNHTNGKYAKSDPDICNPVRGGYGRFSEQYAKLERAIRLDRAAALKSASWGAFQILGENHVQAGHSTVESFVTAMKSGTAAQATAFLAFVRADRRLLAALRQRNWTTFARIYNGPSYKENNYDGKMRANYQRFATRG